MNVSFNIPGRWYLAAAALLAGFAVPALRAEDRLPEAGSTCTGTFSYGDKDRTTTTPFILTFENVAVQPDGATCVIIGHISEPRVDFGPAEEKTLLSVFTGIWTPNKVGAKVALTKTYRFDGHAVEYNGTYDEQSATVAGVWHIADYNGAFTLAGIKLRAPSR